jgi:uncharacterized membrane protein
VILLVLEHSNSYIRFHAWQVWHLLYQADIVLAAILCINCMPIVSINSRLSMSFSRSQLSSRGRYSLSISGLLDSWGISMYAERLIVDGMHTSIQML